jgi:hypothetical protein
MFMDYQGNNMEQEIVTKPHPYIEGLLVRSDGMVYLPKTRLNEAHWSNGKMTKSGYSILFKNVSYLVHRLVAETFVPNPENKIYVDYNDGNKFNIASNNLSWTNKKRFINNRPISPLRKIISDVTDNDSDFITLYNKAIFTLYPEYKQRRNKSSKLSKEKYKDEPEHKQKHKERNKQWHDEHKDEPEYKQKQRKKKKRYYEKHKDEPEYKQKASKINKEYREVPEHKQKHKERNKQWYNEHKDDSEYKRRNQEYKQKYREEHKDDPEYKQKQNESSKRSREKYKDEPEHKQKHKERNKQWTMLHKGDPEYKQKKRESSKRYRAKKKLIKQGLTEIV